MHDRPDRTKKNSAANTAKVIKILAVKATEENSKKILTPIAVSSANISAIGAKSDFEFIEKRASYLFNLLPAALKYLLTLERFPGNWLKITLAVTVIVGLLSNYLGPAQQIHIVYNPITILLVWNLLVYLFIAIHGFLHIRIPVIKRREKVPEESSEESGEQDKDKKIFSNFFLNWFIGGLMKGVFQLKSRYIDHSTRVTIMKKILPSFWISYREVAGKSLLFRLESLLNAGAVGLVIGALTGVYFRGLFFNYNMIWQSTFVSDPETVRTMVNILFGPAGLLLDGHWISAEMISSLMKAGGVPAGPWIHKMALTAFLFIFIPRFILSVYYASISARSKRPLDIAQPYFTEIVLKYREKLIDVIREGLRDIISKKINQTGKTISEFVTHDYYEKIIVPILISFREKGGKIKTFENELLESQKKFEPILLNYLEEVQEDFQESVLTEINLFLGRKLDIDINTVSTYQPHSDEIDQRLPERLAADIGDTIGGTIVTTVALAAGSISGGIGKSLGIAIISGLLGISGPLGLLIGGLITAATLGGVYKLKRNQISGMIKDIPLPAIVISATLTDGKIEKARKETFTHTENEIKKMLAPKANEVTESILKDLTY